ncbi:MAG: TonB-dependent receptor plug domain-containing protein [Gammaproteobacteria bacterium]|nr:TonB-dependent receptor plug domain-containing protein [Gammaproteobacteria bacterium]
MKLKPSTLTLFIAGIVTLPSLAFAQQTTTTNNAPAPAAKVEKIEVTGSNIKRVDSETATPVTIITKEEIERQGINSVAELLRSLPNSSQVGGVVMISRVTLVFWWRIEC